MEPTSEQELKQLLEEGKISEEEYDDLKQAMAEKHKVYSAEHEGAETKPNLASKLGKIALILVLSGIVLPAILYIVTDIWFSANGSPEIGPFVIMYLGMELPGFVMGIISWKDKFGKAATITAGLFMAMTIKFFA